MAPTKDPRERLRVLIVDDDPLTRRLVREMLELGDFDLEEAGDGPEALERVRVRTPDVIVLDLMMPAMSGYDVCRAVRAMPELAGCAVVILTARTQTEDQELGFASGADDYVVKPFSPLQLIERVKRAADVRRSA
jgi:two-component system phosphate regulon response regulator PhoB